MEKIKKGQFLFSEFQDMSNDKKSLSIFSYKYPYTNAYSSHIPGSMPVRKVEEPNEFQYQRGHSFHGQITPKEEFNKDCYQQGLNHQSNNPNLIPKTEVVEQYKNQMLFANPRSYKVHLVGLSDPPELL